MTNALTIFDLLLGGAQPAQGQASAGAQNAGSTESTLPFDMLMQQLLSGEDTDTAARSRLPFVVAPNPALGQKNEQASAPAVDQPAVDRQQASVTLANGQAKGKAVTLSSASPELLMRQLIASGQNARIDLNTNQQIALERSATDGHTQTVSVESLIAQAGSLSAEDPSVAGRIDQPAHGAPVQDAAMPEMAIEAKTPDAGAFAETDSNRTNLSMSQMTGSAETTDAAKRIITPQTTSVNISDHKRAAANWEFPRAEATEAHVAAEQLEGDASEAVMAQDAEATPVPAESEAPTDPRIQLASSQAARQITLAQPTQLGPGTYDVSSFDIHGDRIQFTLTPTKSDAADNASGNAAEKIKISLPAEVVTKALNAAMNSGQKQPMRVQLDELTQPTRRIEAILNQLNVSRMEVTSTESESLDQALPKTTPENTRQIQLTLTPEKSQSTPVRVQVNTNQVQAVSEQRVNLETTPRVSVGDGTGNPSGNGQSFGSQTDGRQDQFGGLFDRHQDMTAGNIKLTGASDASTTSRFDQLLGLEGQADRAANTTTADLPESRPVRMVIPESEMMKLRTTGQTVRLRLEPDTLGPARLTLSMQGDTLKAHVVVDSHQARTAVESSLQELTQQLNRANIKVDHISVEVGSDTAEQQQQFERRPHWHHRPHGSYANLVGDDGNDTSETPTILAGQSAAQGYSIGAGGVNLLA